MQLWTFSWKNFQNFLLCSSSTFCYFLYWQKCFVEIYCGSSLRWNIFLRLIYYRCKILWGLLSWSIVFARSFDYLRWVFLLLFSSNHTRKRFRFKCLKSKFSFYNNFNFCKVCARTKFSTPAWKIGIKRMSLHENDQSLCCYRELKKEKSWTVKRKEKCSRKKWKACVRFLEMGKWCSQCKVIH